MVSFSIVPLVKKTDFLVFKTAVYTFTSFNTYVKLDIDKNIMTLRQILLPLNTNNSVFSVGKYFRFTKVY